MIPAAPNWVEVADLRAQQAMADIAQQVLYLTWGQIWLGVVGTLALFYTLRETRRATSTALMAVRVQQTAERGVMVVEKRALYMTDKAPSATPWEHQGFTAESEMELSGLVTLVNRGKSLALLRSSKVRLLVAAGLPESPVYPMMSETSNHRPIDVGEEAIVRGEIRRLSVDESSQLGAGIVKAWLFGSVTYDDLFGQSYDLRFCYRFTLENHDLVEDGGDAYWRDRQNPRTLALH